ncbi:Set1 complex component spp1 [Cladorrhinum samala]|uniref:Set1 complex component spp1 n=1 Tax=Cladorrhinum samala TaxID=585594 RepID=A0AAV9I5K0_9PEZI|nr:Set1 complex component spp1 [Cladorrhinum samala]
MSFSTSFFTPLDDNHSIESCQQSKPAEMDPIIKQQTADDESFPDLPQAGSPPSYHNHAATLRSSVPPPSSDGLELDGSVMDEDDNVANGNHANNSTNPAPKAGPGRRKKGTATVVKAPKRRTGGSRKPKTKGGGGSTKGASSTTSSVNNFPLSGAGPGVRNGGGGPDQDPLAGGDSDPVHGPGGGNSSESDSGPYCLCRGPDNHRFMIACDRCEDWFHGECIGMDKWTGENLVQKYICPNCSDGDRYVTRYKKMCSLPGCNRAARVDAPKPSIFCSDEHCQGWWEQLIAPLPKSPSSESAAFFDTLTQDRFVGLLDAGLVLPPRAPFATPHNFWESPPPGVLTPEESSILLQSATDRHQLGEEIMLCKKMMQLVDMGIARRDAAIAAGKGTNKDLCGYDVRLDVVGTPYQFGLFLQSPAGEVIFRSGMLEAVTENIAAGVLGNVRGSGVVDEGISEDPVWGGMCLRKKCPPHKQWRDILTKMVKNSIKELAREAGQKLDAEQRIRDSAAERYLRLQRENNSVQIERDDDTMEDM